eukprot:ctg_6509.g528
MSTAGGGVWEPRKRLPISDRDTPPKPSLWSILKDAIAGGGRRGELPAGRGRAHRRPRPPAA